MVDVRDDASRERGAKKRIETVRHAGGGAASSSSPSSSWLLSLSSTRRERRRNGLGEGEGEIGEGGQVGDYRYLVPGVAGGWKLPVTRYQVLVRLNTCMHMMPQLPTTAL